MKKLLKITVRKELDRLHIAYPAKGKGSKKRALRKLLPEDHRWHPDPIDPDEAVEVLEEAARVLELVPGPVGIIAGALADLLGKLGDALD